MSKFFQLSQEVAAPKNDDNQLLNTLINNMSEAVIATDEQGKIILSNSVALSVLDTNNLRSRSLQDALPLINKKGEKVDLQAVLLQTRLPVVSSDWRLRFSDGSLMNLYVSASPVRRSYGADQQAGYVIVFRDITKEKTIEEERNDFISVASHELRTPVAIVEGNVSNALLLATRTGVADSVKQALAAAHDQTLFLGNLINDLAMLSRAERGKLALSVETFDAAKLVDSLVDDYGSQAKQKKLDFLKKINGNVSSLLSSELYVREMLQNFITNAIKYTDKGYIMLSARIAAPTGA